MNYEAQIAELTMQNAQLKRELDQLRKLIFGAKKERFVSENSSPGQLSLFEDLPVGQGPVEEQTKETISYERKKPAKKHEGRNEIPDHLPVIEVIIEPDQDVTGMKKIGEEITETLEYTAASLVKKRIIRPKYALPQNEGIIIGKLPSRPIDKGIAEASLLSYIIVCKFIDHLPFYRQIQIFKREFNWDVSASTINDWFAACCTLLEPLYEELKRQVLSSGYVQVDESPIKVLDSDKPGSTHQGYQWVYHSPEIRRVLFEYRKGRGMHGPKEVLENYNGWLQCDGYGVYDKIAMLPGISIAGCLAHARRYYHEALSNDKKRAEYALEIFQDIYEIERSNKAMKPQERKLDRIAKVKPLMDKLKSWIEEECVKVLPKSAIGKAMNYTQSQWHKLYNLLEDGRLQIDNNLIENKIRPLALGRKNYLFAGSHEGAKRIAMMYSFMGTCKANDVNPNEWLKKVLEKLPDTKMSELAGLLPIGGEVV